MFRCGSSGRIDSANAFTILFDVPATDADPNVPKEEETNNDPFTYYSSSSSSSSSPVDCTLSLGSASTRQNKPSINTMKSSNGPNTLYWDILPQAKKTHSPAYDDGTGTGTGTGGESLLSRRCANCDVTSTPLWRNGPRGPKSLCNACGIRYKKEERRAAAAATFTSTSLLPIQQPTIIDSQHRNGVNYGGYTHSHPWAHAPVSANRMRSGATPISMSSSTGRFSDDNDAENRGMPYYSWCLNAPPPSRPEFMIKHQ